MQPALQLALLVAILLPIGKLAASVCTRVGIPGILGELLAGVVLGPGAMTYSLRLFKGGQATGALLLLSQVGGIVLMFIAGIETDIDRMQEASKTAFIVAVSGVVWPFLLGTGVAHLFGLSWNTSYFLGGALTATSVSISARTFMDVGQMTSPEATVVLGAAVIDDVIGLFVLAFLAASTTTSQPEAFGVAPMLSGWLTHRVSLAGHHPLFVQMLVISLCVGVFFVVGYAVARRWLIR